MASASVPGIHGWGNLYYPSLRGVLRPPAFPRRDLRTPFFFGHGIAGLAGHRTPHVCRSALFRRPTQPKIPPKSRFLIRPPPDAHVMPLP